VDGFRAAEDLRAESPSNFDLLAKERVHHRYIEEGHYVESLDPILKTHPVSKELEMVRYNHYDRSPISTIPQERLTGYYDALAHFSSLMTRQSGEYWLKLWPGTVLFVDNWRVLHGRASFTGSREMSGCYLPRDDWIGIARVEGLM
jgi:trimethyllysine dioxygenase